MVSILSYVLVSKVLLPLPWMNHLNRDCESMCVIDMVMFSIDMFMFMLHSLLIRAVYIIDNNTIVKAFFNSIFKDYLLLMYTVFCLQARRGVPYLIIYGCQPLCGCWELNSGPLSGRVAVLNLWVISSATHSIFKIKLEIKIFFLCYELCHS